MLRPTETAKFPFNIDCPGRSALQLNGFLEVERDKMSLQGPLVNTPKLPISRAYNELVALSPEFALLDRLGLISPSCKRNALRGFYRSYGKRVVDLAIATTALAVLSPVMIGVAGLSLWVHGRPLLFRQVRVGYGEEEFRVFKFRTMTNERGADGQLLPDEIRLTKLGRMMRKYSVDELPQLFNVFLGQMSLIGPRPLLRRYVSRYTLRQRRRHTVKPGVSGLAQALGNVCRSWEHRFEADAAYANSVSFRLDAVIIVLTLIELLRRMTGRSMSEPDQVEFWGSQGRPEHGPLGLPTGESGN
jgi:undecaprenyl phosphate N,N'-diacetylbacillosamine 1-phosphate transferase